MGNTEVYCILCDKFYSPDDYSLHFDECEAQEARTRAEQEEDLKKPTARVFNTGATRDTDEGKLDYEGFLSPLVLQRYAEYMHKHRCTSLGIRDSDNWQRGFDPNVARKSLIRHTFQYWQHCREGFCYDNEGRLVDPEEALCAIIFNASCELFERLRARKEPHASPETE